MKGKLIASVTAGLVVEGAKLIYQKVKKETTPDKVARYIHKLKNVDVKGQSGKVIGSLVKYKDDVTKALRKLEQKQ